MRVSIVIPSLNQGDFIERTIQSVLAQQGCDLEVLVIDGGSTDQTSEILRGYSGAIRVLSEPDAGQSAAINKGFTRATGEVLAWLNSDDTYLPEAAKGAATLFERNPRLGMVYGRCWMIEQDDSPIREYDLRARERVNVFDDLLSSDPSFIPQPTVFLSRMAVEDVGLLDENLHMCMDYEYWLRVSERWHVGFVPDFTANIRIHRASKSSRYPFRSLREIHAIRAKYHARLVSEFYPRQLFRLAKAMLGPSL